MPPAWIGAALGGVNPGSLIFTHMVPAAASVAGASVAAHMADCT